MRPFFVLLVLIVAHVSVAQDEVGRLLFTVRNWGLSEGLPHRSVTSVAQDRRGFIWVGTALGLSRFDGYGFMNFTRSEGLSSDAVRTVACDADGLLWVYHANGLLDVMDPRTLQVKALTEHFGGALPREVNGAVSSLSVSPDGIIAFAQVDRIVRYGGKAIGFTTAVLECEGLVDHVRIVENGEVWCACHQSLEYEWPADLVRVSFSSAEGRDAIREVERMVDVPSYTTRTDVPSPDTVLILAGDGMVRSAWSREVRKDSALFRIRLGDDRLVHIRASHMPAEGEGKALRFAPDRMWSEHQLGQRDIITDRAGNIWAAGEYGLYRINIRRDLFQRFLHHKEERAFVHHRIRGMLVAGQQLHANSESSGYHVLDLSSGSIIRSDPSISFRVAMAADGSGGLWRGADLQLLHENAQGMIDRVIRSPSGSYACWSVLALPGGGVLMGTEKGLRSVPVGAVSSQVLSTRSAELDAAWIWSLQLDRSGSIMACTNAGLFRLNADGRVSERWWSGTSPTDDPMHHLPTDDIRHMYEDSSGVRWLATATRGLLRWNGTGAVRVIGPRDGLPATSIHAIQPDAEGTLWMSTDNGLVRFDPVSGQMRVFTTDDGIASNEFNRIAHARAPDGRLFFGGVNGITAFHPGGMGTAPNDRGSPLVLKHVRIQHDNQALPKDVTVNVLDGGQLVMRPDDRFFTVEMALLSYDDPASIRYAWRIDGIDPDWNVQREPDLRFTALPYGEHRLRVKAQDAEGRWSDELTVPLLVVRPFYLRWWFLLLVTVALGAAIYFVMRYREDQLRRVIRMRDRIATDLHDEVGSNLSSIVLFSTAVSKHKEVLPDYAADMLQRIKENSKRAMESMNDIVWSVNSGSDSMEDLLDRMRAYAGPLCEAADITVEFDVEAGSLTRRLAMDQRKNLYLIFKEAVNNAVRHARCTRIDVSLKWMNDALELTVMDDGIGLPGDAARGTSLGGNGLGNMDRRAREIGGAVEVLAGAAKGTQVRFRFAPKPE